MNWTEGFCLIRVGGPSDSALYEQLVLSRDREEVQRLSTEGYTIEKPKDLLKPPIYCNICP